MEDAIKKVLEMLEAGKISSEEAERLIRAIKESGKKESKKEFAVENLENLGEFISEIMGKSLKTAFSSAFKFAKGGFSEKINMEISAKEKVKINTQGSEIEIKSGERENTMIKGIGVQIEAFNTEDNETLVEIQSGEAEILMPSGKDIELLLQGSEAEVRGNFRNIDINAQGSDLEFHSEFERAKIKVFGGDFTLTTSKKPLQINAKIFGGDVELPDGFKKQGNVYIFGDGEHKEIEVEIYGGDFELKFKE